MLEIVNQLDGFDSRGNIKVKSPLSPSLAITQERHILCQTPVSNHI